MWKQLGPEEALLTTIGFGDSHSSPPVAGATQGGHRISMFQAQQAMLVYCLVQ